MYFALTKKTLYRSTLFIFTAVLFFSCQKEFSIDNGNAVLLPDLKTKVSSSVSGFVTDENDAAVKGATVQFGTSTITTDKYGYFEAKNVLVVKDAAVVTVSKTGYFKGIKTYMAKEGKAAFFRIKLIPKTIVGNINSTAGGTVTLANGLSIALPAGALVNAATNTPYTGTINIAAYWINPEAADLNSTMPGDLRGIDKDGSMKLLKTFGMAAVELTGASGELLQIAAGKKATLSLAIPASLSADAPASIPLWYFDETNGLWKEQGNAVKTGNTYVGEVSHFSFWNWDVPGNYVQFDCTLHDVSGNPIPYTLILIHVAGTTNYALGYTDASGYVSGAVPANAQLVLEVFTYYVCNAPLYTQTFNTTNANISLGVITITSGYTANISGTVTDCNTNAVTNGYIIILINGYYTYYPVSNTGTFNFPFSLCTNSTAVTLIAEDLTALQQSSPVNVNLVPGSNVIGNLQACNNSIAEFLNYSINGTNYSYTAPVNSVTYFTDQ
ncbi:MAG: carboxypeptidase regulatory-like domain-containing protein [Chitinophagaceae bacterium]|nr:carboxypeptidase regulatory-like domain-containing protein [Chitinophagaceae bacterium]